MPSLPIGSSPAGDGGERFTASQGRPSGLWSAEAMAPPPRVLRPETSAFVVLPAVRTLAVLLVTALWAATWVPGVGGPSAAMLVGAALLLGVGRLVLRALRLRKERYELHADRIVWRSGALWWERRVDLKARNITLVQCVLPWIEHRLLGTGRVALRAAGASRAAIRLTGIVTPAATMDRIVALMQESGFRLRRTRLLQEERPSVLGAFILAGSGTLRPILAGLVPILVTLFTLLGELGLGSLTGWILVGDPAAAPPDVAYLAEARGVPVEAIHRAGVAVAWALAFGILAALLAFVLAFIDRIKRVYRLYEDTIDFEDGFLKIERELIPLESFSDSELEQSLIQRLLGLSNLKLSGRGAGSDVRFWMMPGGPRFAERLDRLLSEERSATAPRVAVARPLPPGSAGPVAVARPIDPGSVDPAASAPLHPPAAGPVVVARPIGPSPARLVCRMDTARALAGPAILGFAAYAGLLIAIGLGLLLLPPAERQALLDAFGGSAAFLLGPLLGGVIAFHTVTAVGRAAIAVFATRYIVDGRKVAEHYRLLSTRSTEFGHEKITGISVSRDPIDRLFGCATIACTSIGSAQALRLRHVREWAPLVAELRSGLGMPQSPPTRTLRSAYTFGRWPRGRPLALGLLAVAAVAFLALGLAISPRWLVLFAACAAGFVGGHLFNRIRFPRHRLALHPTHIHHTYGVLVHRDVLARWDSIKDLDTVRYVGLDHGTLELRVAGPLITAIHYVADVLDVHEALDAILWRHPIRGGRFEARPLDTTTLDETRPKVAAVCLSLVQLGLRFLPLLPLLPIVLPASIPWIRRIRYRIERDRLVRDRGLLLFRRRSVLYNRVDHIEEARRFVDRLFGTGTIAVHTVGSLTAELTLLAVGEPSRRYELIETHLPSRGLPDEAARGDDRAS
jgi:membrane protein YdbS with pleckstrin-like domain